ncbi:uncharacterized protein [Venturia canescens]|uniref:uncharacterized protein n=1 Tax=Venturia canescens TaxID=32260 RepID=UPI001C9C2068|nr:uncharacterized protein LOC122417930 [Venturia canescens]
MKLFIVLFAFVAAVSAFPGYDHHVEHVQVLHVAQPAAVPPLHPHPLKLEAHNHVVRIPLHANKVSHPHLIGVEHYHEPEIHVKPVHGHGHGW